MVSLFKRKASKKPASNIIPSPPKRSDTLENPPLVAAACRAYYNARESATKEKPFEKDAFRKAIFEAAQQVWKDRLRYAESCAASYMFHVIMDEKDTRATVWAIHLTEECKEESKDFNLLRWCEWGNAPIEKTV